MFSGIIIFLAMSVFSIGTYLVWPSRLNVVNHFKIGFCFTAYFVPAIILQVHGNDASDAAVNMYVTILALGVTSFTAAMVLGYFIPRLKLPVSFMVMSTEQYEQRALKITKICIIASCLGLLISYAIMGFIPMFASDPISAKFFKGAYQAPYMRVAVLYRTSFNILVNLIPLSVVMWYKTRKYSLLFLSLFSVGILMISLARGPAFTGIILAIGMIMSLHSRRRFIWFIAVTMCVYIFGSTFYFVAGLISVEDLAFIDPSQGKLFWQLVAAGNPDIADTISFVRAFDLNPIWTYGRTFYGGLIPGHYEWNPAVYVFKVTNPAADINDIASGGFRMPSAIWGYTAFGWLGVMLTSGLSGLISGYTTKYFKYWMQSTESLIVRVVIVMTAYELFGVISGFFALSIYDVPPCAIFILYLVRFKLSSNSLQVALAN